MASVMEEADKEIAKIVNQRFTTIFEKRLQVLRDGIELTKREFAHRGLGRSGPLVEKILELRCKAVRDIVSERFNIAKEIRSKYRLSWTDNSLDAMTKDLQEWIDGQFSGQRDVLKQDFGRMGLGNESWPLRELEKEQASLTAEIIREIEALRSELKIQQMTGERNHVAPRSIHINLSGGQIGVLNVAGIIESIEQNLSTTNQPGGENLVEAIKSLTEAVMASKELKEDDAKQALEHLEFLSRQPALPPEKRAKTGIIKSVFRGMAQLISTASDVSQLWSIWGAPVATQNRPVMAT